MANSIVIIAEVGSNYGNDLELAKKYVMQARASGAAAVKFQTLRKNLLVAPRIYDKGVWIDNPVYEKFSNLELPDEWHFELKRTADEQGIEFIASPFYLEAVDLLEEVGVGTYKIASGDITFFPLLERIASTGKKVIMSTGASNLRDVERALSVLSRRGVGEVTLLHCVSNYPPQWDEMNLRAITELKSQFGTPVGISDHTPGHLVPVAAIALGATVIEKHVTFDRALPGPDHPFAMTFQEFGEMVRQIDLLERALGSGVKAPTPTEQAKQHRIRRGIYDPLTLAPSDSADGLWLRPQHGETT